MKLSPLLCAATFLGCAQAPVVPDTESSESQVEQRPRHISAQNGAGLEASQAAPVEMRGLMDSKWKTVLFSSPDFVRSAEREGPPYQLKLSTTVRNPVTDRTERWSSSHAVSFRLEGASGVTANEFVLFGYARNNIAVFEHWKLPPDEGAYYSQRPLPETPVGTPAPLGVTTVSVLGAYTSPSKRDNIFPNISRSEIYRGPGLDPVMCFAVDPEARFVFVVTSAGELRRLYVKENLLPETIYGSAAHPVLGEADSICPVFHASQGLGWRVMGPQHVSMFWDGNNDGIIDSASAMLTDDFHTLYPYGSLELL